MTFTIVTTEQQLADAYSVRKTVFVEEQKVPEDLEIDEHEKSSVHFVLYQNDQPIGAGRFRLLDGLGKVERICVLNENRHSGIGRALMDGIEQYAKNQGIERLKLNAQTSAIRFYSKLGYEIVSEEFLDAGIPHKTMVKTL